MYGHPREQRWFPGDSTLYDPAFVSREKETERIDVRLSYRIVRLVSKGLDASPNKALEELVANSPDDEVPSPAQTICGRSEGPLSMIILYVILTKCRK